MRFAHVLHPAVTLLALAAPVLANGPSVVINELDADQGAPDTAEFVELFYPGGNKSLTGYFLVFYDGSVDAEYRTFDLSGNTIPSDGYFVIGPSGGTNVDYSAGFPATNAILDGADAVALWHDTGTSLTASSFAGTTVTSPPSAAELVDALVYGTSDPADAGLLAALTPNQPQVDENANSSSATESCSRGANLTPLMTAGYSAQSPTPGVANNGLPGPGWGGIGLGLAGVTGVPVLSGTGTLAAGSPGTVWLDNAAPSAFAVVFVSASEWDLPFHGGTLVPGPRFGWFFLVTNAMGSIHLSYASWPSGFGAGDDIYLQYWIQDSAAVQGFSASNALRGVTQ